jgi:integrase
VRISPQAIQRYVNELNEDYAPNTIRRIYGVLNQLLRLAEQRRYIALNPCDAVKLPKKRGRRREITIQPLTHEQVRALVAAIDPQYRLAILLDAYLGLRAGELWALRRDDIDLLRGQLRVDEALSEVPTATTEQVPEEERLSDSLIVKGTKTDATRTLRLPDFLRSELAEHLTRPLGGDDARAFIFTTADGCAVRHNNLYKRVYKPAVVRALPATLAERFRFHDLRHTCAAFAIEAGAHPFQIKTLLGHEDIRTTLNIYGHLFPSTEDALADALDAGYRKAAMAESAVLPLRRER